MIDEKFTNVSLDSSSTDKSLPLSESIDRDEITTVFLKHEPDCCISCLWCCDSCCVIFSIR